METAVAEAEAARAGLTERNADGRPRRPAAKCNLGHLPDHLPRIEQVIEPAQKICPCGCAEMVKTGEDRAERLDIVPARFQVIVTIRPRYACRRCDAVVMQADTPNWLIEGGLPAEGTLAHVAVSKYADHLPLYRQCQIYGRGGVDLDRLTSANWCGVAAYHLAPVVDRMLIHLKRSGRLFMDESRAPVLDPKPGKTKTGYLWAVTRDDRGWGGGEAVDSVLDTGSLPDPVALRRLFGPDPADLPKISVLPVALDSYDALVANACVGEVA